MARTILVLMVGDEGDLVERCVRAALPHVDGVVCQFNGPDPSTGFNVGEWPGVVATYWTPWRSFGANRTDAFQHARAACLDWGWEPADTYALVLDADHVLQGPARLDPGGAPGYRLEHRHADGLRYQTTRLMRLDLPWRCDRYPTHEVWECAGVDVGALPALIGTWIDDRDDGRCKADKYERDERLIREYLAQHPNDPRMTFYLAQTLWCMWKRDRTENRRVASFVTCMNAAIACTWDQERYVALLRAAECARDTIAMRDVLKRAVDVCPGRAEAYILRGHVCHSVKDWDGMWRAGLDALWCIPDPRALFVDSTAYGWQARDMIALGAFRCGHVSTARAHWTAALACDPPPDAKAADFIRRGLEACGR